MTHLNNSMIKKDRGINEEWRKIKQRGKEKKEIKFTDNKRNIETHNKEREKDRRTT